MKQNRQLHFILGFLSSFFFAFLVLANDADPEGVYEYCQTKMNKTKQLTHCQCMTEKYYSKKAELEQLYGVPIDDKNVTLMHINNACHNVGNTGDAEYQSCLSGTTFNRSKNKFGAEQFCQCYSEQWQKQLTAFSATANNVLDKNTRQYLKGNARAICKNTL